MTKFAFRAAAATSVALSPPRANETHCRQRFRHPWWYHQTEQKAYLTCTFYPSQVSHMTMTCWVGSLSVTDSQREKRMPERRLSWGSYLREIVRRAGRLEHLLRRLAPITQQSPGLQSPGPYRDLYNLDEPPPPSTLPYVRAWLLAVAAGADLAELELSDDGLPPIFNPDYIRRTIAEQDHPPKKRRRRGGPLTLL